MKNPKEIIEEFYKSDSWKNPATLKKFLHPQYQQHWHGPKGFIFYLYEQIIEHGKELRDNFGNVKFKISHIVTEGNSVVLRYAVYTSTKEMPDTMILHAHFIAIWEVKDGLLYRCYEVSAPADPSEASVASYK